jgi:hypothetical protein
MFERLLQCTLCKELKPATAEHFSPRADRPGQFYPYCRPCWAVKRNANAMKRAEAANRRCACGCGGLLLFEGTRFLRGHFHPMGMFGKIRAAGPSLVPGDADVIWAAGIYEGEGSCTVDGSVSVPQKDPWILIKLRDFFGGLVRDEGRIWRWQLSGTHARMFLDAVYPYLSPRRRARIDEYRAYVAVLLSQFPKSEWTPRKLRPARRKRSHDTGLSESSARYRF